MTVNNGSLTIDLLHGEDFHAIDTFIPGSKWEYVLIEMKIIQRIQFKEYLN